MKNLRLLILFSLSFFCFKTSFFNVLEKDQGFLNITAPWSNSLKEVSVHEAGHILTAIIFNDSASGEIVEKPSLLLFTEILGVTATCFPRDWKITLEEELDRICFYLAGGIATEIVLGYVSGVSDDKKRVENFINKFIKKHKNKPADLEKIKNYFGLFSFSNKDCNFKNLKAKCSEKTKAILLQNLDNLKLIADELEKKKKLENQEINQLIKDF